ncbi:MAG: cyclopropane-fatty-acyl-phospholipid synthase family protein [Acidibrevibacterium sp.]|jgi:cyclopropane-fatty-acyl-phospholipid synthase|uniref:SAM-dependent methyltransferase n=1 Tax=Acidibrevibacterium fodinaquatile TaxID=1969806 RepID=UPI0023A7ADD7|nr:cyclopropane-fatty-acyl-phospholipid synthase family protein [Acidibrevibacterium fodinaquatile]MCA7119054.1 cyclopropane-fatty-acyl-phospholipid synthase family protein [Acidibrevibacterium fodinaquatile]
MNLVAAATGAVERLPLPDALTRAGIAMLVERTSRRLDRAPPEAERAFARRMRAYPIARTPEAANAQHYELPAEFFALVLGARRKYSCCLYDEGADTLDAAEERALAATAAHAELADGQRILELGCGWGSLTLWMAERYPNAKIVAVSNSAPQRAFIEAAARARGIDTVEVITADMNHFEPAHPRFDRVVSVEMWEHMSNWRALLARVHGWLKPNGRLFLHVFSHHAVPYVFDHEDRADWIARHFFTGGIMPSHRLIRQWDEHFTLEADWRWSGLHYQRTANDWLARYDANAAAIDPILRAVYGREAGLWKRRWRLFFLATAGLFGAREGREWGISHYRLRPR